MKFKVGDKVKINKKIISFKYGKGGVSPDVIGKIIGVREDNEYYVDFPSVRCWHGLEKELELVERKYTYEDLKKAPIGTKITFQNGYLIKFDKERVYGVINGIYYNGKIDYIILFLKGKVTDERFGKIIKIEEPTYKTVYEHKEEILDETEKRYLSNFIKPFRNKVRNIIKTKSIFLKDKEYIIIRIINGNNIPLPYFDKNTMYKGMELEKTYTLEELEI